jgi:hypothetical protein
MPMQSSTLVRGTPASALVFGEPALPPVPEERTAGFTPVALESAGVSAFQLPQQQPYLPAVARAFYDAGEHAWPGENLYPDQLLVGKAPGVLCSYGEIIAMGDLYDTVEDVMSADARELAELKKLIQRSLAYYKGGKTNPVLDVGHGEWEKATHERYEQLAERNYEHFAPGFLFTDPKLHSTDLLGHDHRSVWEAHHARAISEAQQLALEATSAKRSAIPVRALVINAFGDHFLTDAFASGHLLNKGEIIAYFKTKFYSNGSLSKAGARFFEQLADLAWKRGDVAAKFRKLETTKFPGWDIDRPSRFGEFLKGAAKEEPDRVANFALKVLHDKLNKDGVEVENDAGGGPWKLTGDGFLTAQSLNIMKLAVAQSAANITDGSILASNIDVSRYQAKVWAYVPRFTAASKAKVRALVTSYVDPGSKELLDAAADIIKEQVDLLIKLAKKKGKLEPRGWL